MKMNKNIFKRIIVNYALVGFLFLLSGCAFVGIGSDNATKEEKKWVAKMNETFSDDTFTYAGHTTTTGYGVGSVKKKNSIYVKSEKYPDNYIIVEDKNGSGSPVTNYNRICHNDSAEEYFEKMLGDYFDYDHIEVIYTDNIFYANTPIENITSDEYIKNYVVFDFQVNMVYTGDYPSEEEMKNSIIKLVRDNDTKGNISIRLYHKELDDYGPQNADEEYFLHMKTKDYITGLKHYIITYDQNGERDYRINQVVKDETLD